MRLLWARSRGMTLMELLIALGLGASLSAAIMQLFTDSMHLQSVQRSEQDLQQRSAYAQFILRAGIRESAAACAAADMGLIPDPGHRLELLAAGTGVVNALPGSQVLRLRSSDCEEPVHFFYIGRRSSGEPHPTGLYRRRQRSDGTFRAAEELVEGVTEMTARVGLRVLTATSASDVEPRVAYVELDQVVDWSRVFSVNLTLSLQPVSPGAATADEGVIMTFSTALRHVELHGTGQGAE